MIHIVRNIHNKLWITATKSYKISKTHHKKGVPFQQNNVPNMLVWNKKNILFGRLNELSERVVRVSVSETCAQDTHKTTHNCNPIQCTFLLYEFSSFFVRFFNFDLLLLNIGQKVWIEIESITVIFYHLNKPEFESWLKQSLAILTCLPGYQRPLSLRTRELRPQKQQPNPIVGSTTSIKLRRNVLS